MSKTPTRVKFTNVRTLLPLRREATVIPQHIPKDEAKVGGGAA